jgi:hypothetical protein
LYDIGELTIEDAARRLGSEYNDFDASWEIFGVKLPGALFVGVSFASLALSFCILVWATRRAGRLALSEVMRDLPLWVMKIALLSGVSVAPAIGLMFAADRMRYAISSLSTPLKVLAIKWLVLTSIGTLEWIFPAMRRAGADPIEAAPPA